MQGNARINQFMFEPPVQSLFQFEPYGRIIRVSRIHWNYAAAWCVLFSLQDFTFCVSEVETNLIS